MKTRLIVLEVFVREEHDLISKENNYSDDEELLETTDHDITKKIKLIIVFDGSSAENFIQLARTDKYKTRRNERLTLLPTIILQKFIGKAIKSTRIDGIKTHANFFGRLKILFGERELLESLFRHRDLCMIRQHESLDNYVG